MAKTIKLQTTKQVVPKIYAYTTPEVKRHDGWTKIGYTEGDVAKRLKQQLHTADIDYRLEWSMTAIYDDGSGESFRDADFHAYLRKEGVEQEAGKNNEWFHIDGPESERKCREFKENRGVSSTPEPRPYALRKEQEEAVERARSYFERTPGGEFLWNAKPRFGKTLAVYDLCLRMKAKKVLIVTNRPAVANSWLEDYLKFVGDAKGYRFVSDTDALRNSAFVTSRQTFAKLTDNPGFFEFLSLQDLKGSIYFGGEYDKLKHVGDLTWDLLVVDEAHEGVDTDKTDVAFDRIARKHTLHLSGTPFKALANDKFSSDAIYNWTYADEQRAKRDWTSEEGNPNPYADLPQLRMFTYQASEMIRDVVNRGIEIDGETEEYAFDLNEFFAVNDKGRYIHNDAVDRFLDALTTLEKYPFSTEELRGELKHTLWLLDRVESARKLAKKLENHPVFSQYEIVLAAGDGKIDDDSENLKAYNKVKAAILQHDKTITLSVGQLTTGVTIPEWSAVLMLSNVKSPALYMQAAFRAQNPCLFREGTTFKRKENACVFDFDPARTLIIFEEFANGLDADTTAGKGDLDARKRNVRELLNFFPVIGEDDEGEMVELDAERVLSIPRKIKAVEVVKRGFMSNFLFQNIGAVFGAPRAVLDIIENFEAVKEDKFKAKVEGVVDAKDRLSLDDEGEVQLPDEIVIGKTRELFGDKITRPVEEILDPILENVAPDATIDEVDKAFQAIRNKVKTDVVDVAVDFGKEKYGDDFGKKAQNAVAGQATSDANQKLGKAFANFKIKKKTLETEQAKALAEAETEEDELTIRREFAQKARESVEQLKDEVSEVVGTLSVQCGERLVTRVETDKREAEKNALEEGVRDHLRGFSRTIPSFLMAYGSDREITLENFDQIVPEDVFLEATGITLENFRFLRDGGTYRNDETGKDEFFKGRLFDEIVFNDSVKEFLALKKKLADYFDEEQTEDIFDYIPPQKTNQIFTPKKVVVQMVDLLERENPGCFDDPEKTFADLYMKSGLYLAEIVKRLFRSETIKKLYPDPGERLKHIFANQVYGLAPTEIIYRIALAFVLGFDDDVKIGKHNLRLCDALKRAKAGTLEDALRELFPERSVRRV